MEGHRVEDIKRIKSVAAWLTKEIFFLKENGNTTVMRTSVSYSVNDLFFSVPVGMLWKK